MKTRQEKTFEVLGGYLMSDNTVNAEYIAREIQLVILDNTETGYREMHNTRRRARAVAIEALMAFVNEQLNEWNPGAGLYATNAQVMKFDREHGGSLEKALDIVEAYIIEERAERAREQ